MLLYSDQSKEKKNGERTDGVMLEVGCGAIGWEEGTGRGFEFYVGLPTVADSPEPGYYFHSKSDMRH